MTSIPREYLRTNLAMAKEFRHAWKHLFMFDSGTKIGIAWSDSGQCWKAIARFANVPGRSFVRYADTKLQAVRHIRMGLVADTHFRVTGQILKVTR